MLGFAFSFGPGALLLAAIIGTNAPAVPITVERVATLPANEQSAWREYLKRSRQQMIADKVFLITEMKKNQVRDSLPAPKGKSESRVPLDHPLAWYSQSDALRIAAIVLSFQTPAGGWAKGVDMTLKSRAPGQQFYGDTSVVHLSGADPEIPRDLSWHYIGTFDNDATITQLRFLANVATAVGPDRAINCRSGFLRGLDFIFASQFPNGGWPQVWPLQGDYSAAITYNDNAMINVMQFLSAVAKGRDNFAFVPKPLRERAATSVQRGIECILETQIKGIGGGTVWCQQHDALTLQPTSARNYEMAAQCGAESAKILAFLMDLPNPDPRIVSAVHAAALWLEKNKLHDVAQRLDDEAGKRLVRAPGEGPLWARYYEIGTDRPVFGDRDKTIHDDMNEISQERRNGYSWFNESPRAVLDKFARWRKLHPRVEP